MAVTESCNKTHTQNCSMDPQKQPFQNGPVWTSMLVWRSSAVIKLGTQRLQLIHVSYDCLCAMNTVISRKHCSCSRILPSHKIAAKHAVPARPAGAAGRAPVQKCKIPTSAHPPSPSRKSPKMSRLSSQGT